MTTQGGTVANQSQIPIVYTIRGCASCVKLLEKWNSEGITYDERRVELSQATLDEARQYGKLVPIVVWPDGRVEQGFGDSFDRSTGHFFPGISVHQFGSVVPTGNDASKVLLKIASDESSTIGSLTPATAIQEAPTVVLPEPVWFDLLYV